MNEERDIKVGETYRHFSGNYYRVICLAIDTTSENHDEVVVYESLNKTHTVFTRPVKLFNELVDKKKYPEAMQEYKFEPVYDEINLND